jgi:triphosphoribosyl-dephospho-CoA synthase
MTSTALTIGQCATLACLLEVAAPKPGNVHRGVDFDDLSFTDFAVSAVAIAPAMEAVASGTRVGTAALQAVQATRRLVPTNTNLGIVLLLTPLAAVPRNESLSEGISRVLGRLNAEDARDVYQAIRLAEPGGLGDVDEMDVRDAAPDDLLTAMRAAAERDLVAQQYVNDYAEVLGAIVPWLREGQQAGWSTTANIVHAYVQLLNRHPDSLIARKCGLDVARTASRHAAKVLEAGSPGDAAYHRTLADLDFWLRADHHRRNPGTTADLITAGLFAALRDGIIEEPFR